MIKSCYPFYRGPRREISRWYVCPFMHNLPCMPTHSGLAVTDGSILHW